jgi:hypothetical protein
VVNADPARLAIELLLATKRNDDGASRAALAELAELAPERLAAGLPNDDARLAFWIDLYNAAMQLQPSDEVGTWRGRLRLFRRQVITVAGQGLSLDTIEHGLLRGSRWKLSLGYGSNPRPAAFERAYRVSRRDPRIHFALNCGAASCPPIAAYEPDRIDAQLELATFNFLASEVSEEGDVLRLPTVFLWFLGDFGGRAGTRRFLQRYGVDAGRGRIRYQRWDWTPAPDRWKSDA